MRLPLPLLLLPLATLPGCGKPEIPDTGRPPEPQAVAPPTAIAGPAGQHNAAHTVVDAVARSQRAATGATGRPPAIPAPQ